jgi:hypothetical protein
MNTAKIIDYLRRSQCSDGSFAAYTCAQQFPFAERREQPTDFVTMQILECLQDVPGTADIRRAAGNYLQSQVRSNGAWNYWKSPTIRPAEPYPDDLDDTACAVAALSQQDPTWSNGERMGQFARLLVSAEQHVGGPYNTWLINTQSAPQWRHIDVAVNANIAYALSKHHVRPQNLYTYLAAAPLKSNYYVGIAPVLYFLSRLNSSRLASKLRHELQEMCTQSCSNNPLETAMLLSASCRIGLSRDVLQPLAKRLQMMLKQDHWAAVALYVDPVYNSKQYYGGSAGLTTAFALEACTLYATFLEGNANAITPKTLWLPSQFNRETAWVQSRSLVRQYRATARQVISGNHGKQIAQAGTLVQSAVEWTISAQDCQQLDLGGLNGWIAYTLYDKILDGDGQPDSINIANLAHRCSYQNFLNVAGQASDIAEHIRTVFDTMDSANHWEQQHARVVVKNSVFRLRELPNYEDYHQLAERSLGHSLVATSVFWLHFRHMEDEKIQLLQQFFKHFLIARQLNDDAHDWQDDIRAGQLTAVVVLLLQHEPKGTVYLNSRMPEWRQHFWSSTIDTVTNLISYHCDVARTTLAQLPMDPKLFDSWLNALEHAAASAQAGRNQALEFIKSYNT